jgi:hypothetical protein
MNIQMNRIQTGVNYPGLIPLKNYFEKVKVASADVSAYRPGGTFSDIETESEMIRSAQMLIESAKAAQASLSHLLGEIREASIK